ncbi:MAG: hypothetical protein HY098_02620 [Nitrospinae bacterium]|nr:hypothetical protein [Nitrospinota bacterium]
MEWRMAEGADYDEAVASLLKTMGADVSEVEIEKLGEQRKLFGLGGVVTRIRGRLKDDAVPGERPRSAPQRTPRPEKTVRELTESETATIAEKAADFLGRIIKGMDVSTATVRSSAENGEIRLEIVGGDVPFPVGDEGEVLDAIQTIVTIYVGRLHEGKARVSVDAGNYRNARVEQLKEIALKAAESAVNSGRKVYLGPMKSLERKVVHAALQDNPGVHTKSQGEGDRRQVVVYPSKPGRS